MRKNGRTGGGFEGGIIGHLKQDVFASIPVHIPQQWRPACHHFILQYSGSQEIPVAIKDLHDRIVGVGVGVPPIPGSIDGNDFWKSVPVEIAHRDLFKYIGTWTGKDGLLDEKAIHIINFDTTQIGEFFRCVGRDSHDEFVFAVAVQIRHGQIVVFVRQKGAPQYIPARIQFIDCTLSSKNAISHRHRKGLGSVPVPVPRQIIIDE